MARGTFGTQGGDYVADSNNRFLAGRTVTFWSAETGGTQYTDLLVDGAAASSVRSVTGGRFRVQGPDGVRTMWADEGDSGNRTLIMSAEQLTEHEADTTAVHGIADTARLLTTTDAPELIRDTIGTALVAGTGVTITPNDAADTITIAASGTPLTVGGPVRVFQPGMYSMAFPAHGNTAKASFSNGVLHCLPILLARGATWDRIGIQVGTAVASTVIRLGLYADNGDAYPGALISEFTSATQIDSSTTGVKELTISQALSAGTLYWLAYLAQGGAPEVIVLNQFITWAGIGADSQGFAANPGSVGVSLGWEQTGLTAVSTAMPATFTATKAVANIANLPNIFVRTV